MPFSARNLGAVTRVESAGPMGRVDVDAGDAGELTVAVTDDAESRDLSPADEVEAVVEATSVLVDAGD